MFTTILISSLPSIHIPCFNNKTLRRFINVGSLHWSSCHCNFSASSSRGKGSLENCKGYWVFIPIRWLLSATLEIRFFFRRSPMNLTIIYGPFHLFFTYCLSLNIGQDSLQHWTFIDALTWRNLFLTTVSETLMRNAVVLITQYPKTNMSSHRHKNEIFIERTVSWEVNSSYEKPLRYC